MAWDTRRRTIPVGDFIDPKTKATVAHELLTCHQPHSGDEPGMLVKDQKNDMNFCNTCHVNPMNLMDVQIGGK